MPIDLPTQYPWTHGKLPCNLTSKEKIVVDNEQNLFEEAPCEAIGTGVIPLQTSPALGFQVAELDLRDWFRTRG